MVDAFYTTELLLEQDLRPAPTSEYTIVLYSSFRSMSSSDLLRYAFLWTIARLILAAIALLIGGKPLITVLLSIVSLQHLPIVYAAITIAWLISGAASVYLLYMWHMHGKKLFGKHDAIDMGAFLLAALSGINLGVMGVTGVNLGISIVSGNYVAFLIMAILYLASAYHLYTKWDAHHQKLFH